MPLPGETMCVGVAPVPQDVDGRGEVLWHGHRVMGTRVFLLSVVMGAWVGPARSETYVVSADNTLALDRAGALTQTWTAACDAVDPSVEAVLTTTGKDLRYFAAVDEPVEVGVDTTVHDVEGGATGRYEYAVVPGARVMARLTVHCGTSVVFDEAVFDSSPVTVPPRVNAPAKVVDVDTLQELQGGTIPVGRTVELVGIEVQANPRAAEVVEVVIRGAGIDTSLVFGDGDFVDGSAIISPQLTATAVGALTVEARFEGVAAEALMLTVVPASVGPDEQEASDVAAAGCHSLGGRVDAGLPAAVMVFAAGRRRRRHHRLKG
jgi:hypothetical protein